MRDAWTKTTLGEIAEVNPEKTPKWASEHLIRYLDIASVSWGQQLPSDIVPQPFGQAPGRARRRIRTDDVVVSTVRPNLRAMGVVPEHLDGEVASTGFAVLRARDGVLLPGFLWALVSHQAFTDSMVQRATGSNYPAIRATDVASYRLGLPPLDEQQRIVDLIGTLDDTLAAAGKAADSALASRERTLESVFSRDERVEIGSLVEEIQGGRSPKAVDVPPGPGESGVLKVSAVTSSGFVAEAAKRLEDTSPFTPHHRVSSGDVLITRANTAEKVGQVCLVDRDYPNLYLSDKTLRLIPAIGVSPAALVAAMNAPLAREQLSSMSTGTSASMKNVSQQDIRRVRVAWPENATAIGELDQIFLTTYRKHSDMLDRLRDLRANLLTALLSGEHQIPESYDAVMGELVGTGV